MNESISKEKRQLIRKMGNFEPEEDIIVDDQTHTYEAYIDGKHKPASYRATSYPLKDDPTGPILICDYGLINKNERYTYSSLENNASSII